MHLPLKSSPGLAELGAHVTPELLSILDSLYPEQSPPPAMIERPAACGYASGQRSLVRVLHSAKAIYEESLKRPPDAPSDAEDGAHEFDEEGLPALRL